MYVKFGACGPYCCGVFGVTVTPSGLFWLWHDFVFFFELACVATESEVEGRTRSSFKEKVEVVQICLKKYHTADCLNLFLIKTSFAELWHFNLPGLFGQI